MGHPLLDLTSQTAVVIGGTSGIGLALARALAQAEANVVPTGRRAPQVASAVAEIEALGRQSLSQTCDVTDEASLVKLLQSVSAKFGAHSGELRRTDQTNTHARGLRFRLECDPRNQSERDFTRLPRVWAPYDRAGLWSNH